MLLRSYLYRDDYVKLVPMYIHDTTHFSARILEYIPHSDESKKITFSNVEYMEITAKIQSYYGNIANRFVLSNFTIFLVLLFVPIFPELLYFLDEQL